MRRLLVSSFLADVTQQIHSLRASGVMSAHTFLPRESASIALRKSAGIRCTIPVARSRFGITSYRSVIPILSQKLIKLTGQMKVRATRHDRHTRRGGNHALKVHAASLDLSVCSPDRRRHSRPFTGFRFVREARNLAERWNFSGRIYETKYSHAHADTGVADCAWTANKGYVICDYFSDNPPHDDLSVISYRPAVRGAGAALSAGCPLLAVEFAKQKGPAAGPLELESGHNPRAAAE
jgi:hypothetical protein